MKSSIVCGKYDCEFNGNGNCVKKSIGISEDLKCISYNSFVRREKSEAMKEYEKEMLRSNSC